MLMSSMATKNNLIPGYFFPWWLGGFVVLETNWICLHGLLIPDLRCSFFLLFVNLSLFTETHIIQKFVIDLLKYQFVHDVKARIKDVGRTRSMTSEHFGSFLLFNFTHLGKDCSMKFQWCPVTFRYRLHNTAELVFLLFYTDGLLSFFTFLHKECMPISYFGSFWHSFPKLFFKIGDKQWSKYSLMDYVHFVYESSEMLLCSASGGEVTSW